MNLKDVFMYARISDPDKDKLFTKINISYRELKNLVLAHDLNTLREQIDAYGDNLLILQVRDGNIKNVEFLLKNDFDPNFVNSKQGVSALHIAAAKGDEKMCRLLIDYGAIANVLDLEGKTPSQVVPFKNKLFSKKNGNEGLINFLSQKEQEDILNGRLLECEIPQLQLPIKSRKITDFESRPCANSDEFNKKISEAIPHFQSEEFSRQMEELSKQASGILKGHYKIPSPGI